jgi:hypothetical protein
VSDISGGGVLSSSTSYRPTVLIYFLVVYNNRPLLSPFIFNQAFNHGTSDLASNRPRYLVNLSGSVAEANDTGVVYLCIPTPRFKKKTCKLNFLLLENMCLII